MKYQIRSDQFCALSRDSQWQSWLKDVAPDQYQILKAHMNKKKGCRSNKEMMYVIKKNLVDKGFGEKLIKFLKSVFPIALRLVPDDTPERKAPSKIHKIGDLNKHRVFRIYKPHILTFPHKYIIVDNSFSSLQKKVKSFVKTKIYSNYVIVEDRAYIEYFESRFRDEAKKYDPSKSEINLYERKMKQK